MPVGKRLYNERAPKLFLKITQELIDWAIPGDAIRCAIARAILSHIPHASHIAVDGRQICFSDSTQRLRYKYTTPRKCQSFIILFDEPGGKAKCKPFSFLLKPENAMVERMSNKRGGTEPAGARKKRHRRTKQKRAFSGGLSTMHRTHGMCLALPEGEMG